MLRTTFSVTLNGVKGLLYAISEICIKKVSKMEKITRREFIKKTSTTAMGANLMVSLTNISVGNETQETNIDKNEEKKSSNKYVRNSLLTIHINNVVILRHSCLSGD